MIATLSELTLALSMQLLPSEFFTKHSQPQSQIIATSIFPSLSLKTLRPWCLRYFWHSIVFAVDVELLLVAVLIDVIQTEAWVDRRGCLIVVQEWWYQTHRCEVCQRYAFALDFIDTVLRLGHNFQQDFIIHLGQVFIAKLVEIAFIALAMIDTFIPIAFNEAIRLSTASTEDQVFYHKVIIILQSAYVNQWRLSLTNPQAFPQFCTSFPHVDFSVK